MYHHFAWIQVPHNPKPLTPQNQTLKLTHNSPWNQDLKNPCLRSLTCNEFEVQLQGPNKSR